MSTTRILAKEAAFKLLQKGERPTADRVRAAIGQGAQQTILAALDDFWGEVGARLCEPRLPESLVEPVNAIWSQAVVEAGRQWQSERDEFEARIRDLEAEEVRLRQALDETAHDRDRIQALLAEQQAQSRRQEARIAELDRALTDQAAVVQGLEEESGRLAAQGERLNELLAIEREGRERDQTAWLKEVDAARQSLKTMGAEKDSLSKALAEAREARARQDQRLKQDEERIGDLESRLETKSDAHERALAASAELSRRIERLEIDREHDQEALSAWKKRLEVKEAERLASMETADAMRLQSERLSAENRILRDELEAARSNRADLERFFEQTMARLGERDREA